MGILLGLTAGLCFSVASILARFGMRLRSRDDGLFMSIFMNLLVLGGLTLITDLPRWDTAGVAALAAGGVLGTFGGRATNLRAVRIIGPSRANAFLTGGPLVAAIGGWIVLGERISLLGGAGGLLVMAGLYRIIRSRTTAVAVTPAGAVAPDDTPGPRLDPSLGFALAMAAPVLFGLAFVFRKWGLGHYPTAVGGAFIGAAAAITMQLFGDTFAGQVGRRLRENMRRIPWWFVGAGAFTSAALIAQFLAFGYLPAWVVSLLQGTQVLWTLLLAAVVLRQEERIDGNLMISILLVFVGVTAITSQY
ncbi:MAG TPA: EamA family transporter [Acidimicrobiia bacterium]|nr:EamA family transporter [Acidimicrobiia bacterium]